MSAVFAPVDPTEVREFEARYDAQEARILGDHAAVGALHLAGREALLHAARGRRMDEAVRAALRLELLGVVHPVPAEVVTVISSSDDAAIAYLEHLEGRADDAIVRMVRAVVGHGEVARDHDFPERWATQIHTTLNLARCEALAGHHDRAVAIVDAIEASDGDPAAWPFADGPHDPWLGAPGAVGVALRNQILRIRAFLAGDDSLDRASKQRAGRGAGGPVHHQPTP